MIRKIFFVIFVTACVWPAPLVFAVTASDADTLNTDRAKEDYRLYLEQLKKISRQYKQITGEMQQVLAEEGVPMWDDNAGGIFVSKVPLPALANQTFGDADIRETDQEVIVTIDLPGLEKDAIKVSILDGDILRISGERQEQKESQGESEGAYFYKAERQHGSFERQIKLPVPVLDTGMQAKYDNGVLRVTVLKAPNPRKETPIPVE